MARFEIQTCGVFNNEFVFEGSEKDCWAWMKEQWDNVDKFAVKKQRMTSFGFYTTEKYWYGFIKNGRISKELVFDFTTH